MTATIIPHVDDVAGSRSANQAMLELGAVGSVTSGSVMLPPGWLPDLLADARCGALDLGIHLTLTSESPAFRWRPVSTTSRASGLFDDDGYMWPTVAQLRAHAHPGAVAEELATQVALALDAGLDVTHLDHHMGAALAPEYAMDTVQLAIDAGLPVLVPRDVGAYLELLGIGGDRAPVEAAVDTGVAAGVAVAADFVMPLEHQDEPDARAVFRRILASLGEGTTYLSLHCATPGDIEDIHRKDARWRMAEYRLFGDPRFVAELAALPGRLSGVRPYRDRLRGGS